MRLPWGKIAATPVMVACVIYAGWVATHPAGPPAGYTSQIGLTAIELLPPPTPTVTPGPVRAVMFGDSYTGGAAGVRPARTFAGLTCKTMRWSCTNLGYGGSGFIAGQSDDDPEAGHDYRTRIGRQSDPGVKYVIISGGRNDINKDIEPGDEDDAIRQTLSEATVAYPNAEFIVLGAFWPDEHPPKEIVQNRRYTREAASQVRGMKWVSTKGWLTSDLISDDQVHPTAEGHEALEKRLVDALAGLGIRPA